VIVCKQCGVQVEERELMLCELCQEECCPECFKETHDTYPLWEQITEAEDN
jgi:hypothetical protein